MPAKTVISVVSVAALGWLCAGWYWHGDSEREVTEEWVTGTVTQLFNDPISARGDVRETIRNDFQTLYDERVKFGKFSPAAISETRKKGGSSYEFRVNIGRSKLKGSVTIRNTDGTPQISTIRFYPGLNTVK